VKFSKSLGFSKGDSKLTRYCVK